MLPSLVDRNSAAKRENQHGNDETPEVDLLAVPERKFAARRQVRALNSVQQQNLIAGINQRMNALAHHCRAASDTGGSKLRNRNERIADQGGVNRCFG